MAASPLELHSTARRGFVSVTLGGPVPARGLSELARMGVRGAWPGMQRALGRRSWGPYLRCSCDAKTTVNDQSLAGDIRCRIAD